MRHRLRRHRAADGEDEADTSEDQVTLTITDPRHPSRLEKKTNTYRSRDPLAHVSLSSSPLPPIRRERPPSLAVQNDSRLYDSVKQRASQSLTIDPNDPNIANRLTRTGPSRNAAGGISSPTKPRS
jgi:hypothetical protein